MSQSDTTFYNFYLSQADLDCILGVLKGDLTMSRIAIARTERFLALQRRFVSEAWNDVREMRQAIACSTSTPNGRRWHGTRFSLGSSCPGPHGTGEGR